MLLYILYIHTYLVYTCVCVLYSTVINISHVLHVTLHLVTAVVQRRGALCARTQSTPQTCYITMASVLNYEYNQIMKSDYMNT